MWTVESGYFVIRCPHKIGARIYFPRKFKHGRRSKENSFCAPWLLGLISSLLACMQLNVVLLNAEISYARRRLDICKLFTLFTGQNGRQKQLKRVGKHCCPQSSRLNLDEPVRGGTILSILSESGVNQNTCGRANLI